MEDLADLEPLLKAAIGTHVELAECRVANRQLDYWVVLAHLRQPRLQVVIKLAGPQAEMASQFERSAAIFRLVAEQTTLPMPQVLAADTSLQTWPWRYMIRTLLPGTEWRWVRGRLDSAELARAQRQIGEAVAQLHRIGFPAYGEIGGDGRVREPGLAELEGVKEHAVRILPNPRLREIFLQALARRESWFGTARSAGLCHEDLHGSNILFAKRGGEWRLATILDFDKAWAGPAESDLARLEIWHGMASAAFWEAYRAQRDVDEAYPQRRPVYQLLWCLEYARSTPEHLEDTRRVCQELGVAPVERFD